MQRVGPGRIVVVPIVALVMAVVACSPAGVAAQTPAPVIAKPSLKMGATTARVVIASNARAQPGAGRRLWHASTVTDWSNQEQALLVLGSATVAERQWVRVLLPIRPNGIAGWIPADNVVLSHTPYWLVVHKGNRTVNAYRSGRLLRRFRAVIGTRSTPTPNGLAAIYERSRQPNPNKFVGSWVLSLTALSNVLQEFGGGRGRVGLHGRGGASLLDPLGSASSHGCIRVNNAPVAWIAKRMPQGTPVHITH